MLYHYLADLVVVLHGLFVLFVVLGGFLVLWRIRFAWYHVPAVAWAATIEFLGWICPLTPLENILRQKGGLTGYDTGFVEHYIVPVLYPESLTRQMQVGLGILILVLNVGIYCLVCKKQWKIKRAATDKQNNSGAFNG